MHALLWETEWSEVLLQFCHMMGKSIQAPVVGEDSGEADMGPGCPPAASPDFSSFLSSSKTKAVLSAAASAHGLSGRLSHQLASL